jgi:hypothetical protein
VHTGVSGVLGKVFHRLAQRGRMCLCDSFVHHVATGDTAQK